ncbi:YdeI/OmpD-associated family protein [Paenibacillus daejeonensis]|uniref:YdeI/OmpD-associated family protein n=1 Tax=Paenibacillus daejeonensis TaxID=135193 RepID=UPI0003605117|nr:YdeI/OmpD-associated family protein [Paenibacillus daejeonensis]
MEMTNVLKVASRGELRAWLEANSRMAAHCWVIVSMTPVPGKVLYLDAVEEALCFGWIDSTKKKISPTEVAQRLSPRSKRSSWTELNKERVRRLERLGLMTDEGRKVLPDMDRTAFKIDPVIEQRLKEEEQVYANFMAFPVVYRTVRIDTIQSVKAEPELFRKRLDKLIENTRNNKMYGQWHDDGRLFGG